MFKVHEHSKFPDYIAIIILYQSGKKDVTAMELWQVLDSLVLFFFFKTGPNEPNQLLLYISVFHEEKKKKLVSVWN